MKSSIHIFLLLAVYAALAAKGVSASMIRGASSTATDAELESVSRVLLRENPKRSLQRKLKATLSPSPTALPVKGPDYDPDDIRNGRLELNKSPAPSALPVKKPDYDPAKFLNLPPEKPRKEAGEEGPRPAKLLKETIAKAHTKTKNLQTPFKLKATEANTKARKKTTGLLGRHGAKMAHAVKETPPAPKTMVQMSEVVDEILEQGASHSKVPQSGRLKKSKATRR